MIHGPCVSIVTVFLTASAFLNSSVSSRAGSLPDRDERAGPPKTLNTRWEFPKIESAAEWKERAAHIRQHILVSCGLWPLPEKTPLRARVFDRIEREEYSVEKVSIQTYPGFYLAGNLYRPRGRGDGPFPAILNPHGHWSNGRFEDTDTGSIAARCIQFARLGMIAFAYDMVGYGDTHQAGPHRQFATDPTNQLWGISLMGLQTWNSIRALDFLESLPDVDAARLACTGASGGGTQTFMLGAIDDRLAVLAPNVMVSCSMQGGCLCENAPGLRLDFSNMEIAAVAAPRPQLLVAATGDWTKETMTVEGPALESIYRLFGASDRLRYQRFDFPHNYNRTSREAVYRWFAQWLLEAPDADEIEEAAYNKEPDEALRVWTEETLPKDAVGDQALISYLVEQARRQLAALQPSNAGTLRHFQEIMRPAWHHTIALGLPGQKAIAERTSVEESNGAKIESWAVGRTGTGMRLPVRVLTPAGPSRRHAVVLVHPRGQSAYLDGTGRAAGLAARFLEHGHAVVVADVFQTGELIDGASGAARDLFANLFTTYNRTDLQQRTRDLVNLCEFTRREMPDRKVLLCGEGRAGLWALLASPAADAVVVDVDGLDTRSDGSLTGADLFVPGLRRMGGFEAVAALAAPRPLLLHGTENHFDTALVQAAYGAAGDTARLAVDDQRRSEAQLVQWVDGLE